MNTSWTWGPSIFQQNTSFHFIMASKLLSVQNPVRVTAALGCWEISFCGDVIRTEQRMFKKDPKKHTLCVYREGNHIGLLKGGPKDIFPTSTFGHALFSFS